MTTDKDIQVLEEMRDKYKQKFIEACEYSERTKNATYLGDGVKATALTNILSDFRDMRELLKDADLIEIDEDNLVRDSDDKWRVYGNPTKHDSVLDAFRAKQEGQ